MYIALEIYKTKLPLLRMRRAALRAACLGGAGIPEPCTPSVKYAHPALSTNRIGEAELFIPAGFHYWNFVTLRFDFVF